MSRKPIGDQAMTAAERQRRRRARLRAENPPNKPGRPLFRHVDTSEHDPGARRAALNDFYRGWGVFVLLLNPSDKNYSKELAEQLKKRFPPPLHRKSVKYFRKMPLAFMTLAETEDCFGVNGAVLEAVGRYDEYLYYSRGYHKNEAHFETRAMVMELMTQPGELNPIDVVDFFRWLREELPEDGTDEPVEKSA
jgi:hypothetical protein